MQWRALDPKAALSLANKGREVTILEILPAIGRDIGITRRTFILQLLAFRGVKVITEAEVKAITAQSVAFTRRGQPQSILADTVVLARSTRSENHLYQELGGRVARLHILGDAREPRKALDAIHEAASLARLV